MSSGDADPLLPEEHRLIQKAQQGDRAAFARVIDHYYDRLYRWLYHLTHDRHAAEDLTQEAFLKAFAAVKRFRAGSNFRAWLFRIAHNGFINLKRSTQRQREPLPDYLPTSEKGPDELVVGREERARLANAIAALPADLRGAILLRTEEGLSFREIAKILDLTEETARWRVFKARQRLLQSLQPSSDGEDTPLPRKLDRRASAEEKLVPRVVPPEK